MKPLDCDVYMDLMPLVRDGAASEASRQALQSHLAGCERCRALYAALPAAPAAPDAGAAQTLARLRRRALGALGALTLLGAVLGVLLTDGSGLFYNVLLLPLVGAAAYFVLRRRAWLLAPAGMFVLTYVCLAVRYAVIDGVSPAYVLTGPAVWGFWYALFCLGGVGLGRLLHYAFGQPGLRLRRAAAAALALAVLAGLVFALNGLVGNPFSRMAARAAARQLIAEQWPDLELEITDVGYNFKTGGYSVRVESGASIDTRFTLDYDSFGRGGLYGTLEDWRRENAFARAERQYRAQCEELLAPFEIAEADFAYGTLWNEWYTGTPAWAQPDAVFDTAALGRTEGQLVVYVTDDRMNAEAAARWLLRLRQAFDAAGVGFARVDLVLMEPHTVGERYGQVSLRGVRYEDIAEDGLTERAAQYIADTAAYYAAEDEKAAQAGAE